jgi:LacI family transcriptional regulator
MCRRAVLLNALPSAPTPLASVIPDEAESGRSAARILLAGLSVPDDVSVVSFGDDDIASWIRPGVTTVALPLYDLGRRAMDVLFDATEHRGASPPDGGAVHRVAMPVRTRASVTAPR